MNNHKKLIIHHLERFLQRSLSFAETTSKKTFNLAKSVILPITLSYPKVSF
jgi:hypothetical protein